MTNIDPKFILDNSDLLIKEDCVIVDSVIVDGVIVESALFERCKFDDLFKREDFVNTEDETYYLNDDSHVYRVFFHTDDYDYVTDPTVIKKLNDIFSSR